MIERGLTREGSLLLTLEEISQLVSHSHNPGETLANIVELIQRRFSADACSVYLLEPERGELVLGATVGLKPESVGRVRMRLDEGLTGLVAQGMTPVMERDAFQHPRFKYFPETGEDPYHSYLGVPLVEGGSVQGVLVVQTVEQRTFSASEIRMLVTVASQLAPLVGGAQLLGRVAAAAHPSAKRPTPGPEQPTAVLLQGKCLSPGVGQGEAYLVDSLEQWQAAATQRVGDLAAEETRLAAAMDAARVEITRLSQHISTLVGEDHGAILQAQLMILQDCTVHQDLSAAMGAGSTAEAALIQTLAKYTAAFQDLSATYFQERVYDVRDVFRRILWQLRPHPFARGTDGGRIVLVAHEASVMDLFSVDLDHLAAVVVERGGAQSHAAILARSLGVPMVGQVPEILHRIRPGRPLLVNGTSGVIHVDPSPEIRALAGPSLPHGLAAAAGPASPLPAPSATTRLDANINLLCEVPVAIHQHAQGVGLYRTEFLFLARRTLPTEEEQVGIYRKLLDMLDGRPASIRTFDLRPEKLAHGSHLTSSAAGPLDWRLVLDSPPLQQLFKDQVRAILRAATAGPARILVPLVSRTEQLDFVIETVAEARQELRHEGLEFDPLVPLGIMIEVAAATAMVETWAELVDFFALGTNDLVASALGLDRDDPVGASQNDPLHPGLLRLIYPVVANAHDAGRPVTVCGEMATDPEGMLALLALEVDSISVPVQQLSAAGKALRGTSPEALAALGAELLRLRSAAQVRARIRQWSATGT